MRSQKTNRGHTGSSYVGTRQKNPSIGKHNACFSRPLHGFTLIELLIVLGILVMLFAIVGPRVLRSGEKADIRTAQAQIASFKGMLQMYHLDMKSYPSTEQGLVAIYEEPDDLGDEREWDGPYGEGDDIPKDPWGNPFEYEWPSSRTERDSPDIWSLGPDGEDGTEDDICNWKKDDEDSENSEDIPDDAS